MRLAGIWRAFRVVFLVITQLSMAVAAHWNEIVAMGLTREMVQFKALPTILATNDTDRTIAPQVFQALLLAGFFFVVDHDWRTFLHNDPVNLLKGLRASGCDSV
jgi:hypothetical protein